MIDLDHLRGWIGREEQGAELLTPAITARFNATFDLEGAVENGSVAPALIHLCLAPPAAPTARLGPDGHPARGGFLPPVPLPRRMWAGGSMVFHDAIRVGETVSRRSVIRDVTVKEGRSGTLCFVTVEHRIESDTRLVIEERQDIVYRDAAPADASTATNPPPAPQGRHQRWIEPSPPLLFRYSALTFNGHRIHYDNPYARGEEGYPGLIVHGPLQATLLMQFAEDLHGARPRRFEFRNLSPLFDTAPFRLNAEADGDGMRLWTASAEGPVAMEGRVTW